MSELCLPSFVDASLKQTIQTMLKDLQNVKKDKIIEKINDENKFWDGFTELEIAYLLSKMYKIELEPKLGLKRTDIKITLHNKTHYFEVSKRGPYYRMEKALNKLKKTHEVTCIPDLEREIQDKICEESKQLKDKQLTDYGYVIININGSKLNESDISQALFGHTYTTMKVTKNHTTPNDKIKRLESIFESCSEANNVDVFIFYSREKSNSGFQYKGWVYNTKPDQKDVEMVINNIFPSLKRLKS